jgi:hypothetical protein
MGTVTRRSAPTPKTKRARKERPSDRAKNVVAARERDRRTNDLSYMDDDE